MIRFIFFCMAFIAISLFAVPIYFGISETRDQLMQTATIEPEADLLTFEQIYALADGTLMNNPSFLNSIEPAAGEIIAEEFSVGFSEKKDSALANNTIAEEPLPLEMGAKVKAATTP